MPAVYLMHEGHTLASALRPILEANHPEDYVACTRLHPLDDFLVVDAPSVAAVREALLTIKARIAAVRAAVATAEAAPR